MAERISPEQFESSAGVDGWQASESGARAGFRTRTFAAGARFVAAIAEEADALGHHPDVDLRYPRVTVTTVTHDVGGLTDLDVELARRISAIAERLGFEIEPDAPRG